MRTSGYELGAYGNGAALDVLLTNGKITYAWLNPSRGHNGSVSFFEDRKWDLFQTRIAVRHVKLNDKWLEVDLDVQNPDRPKKYVGFWRDHVRFFIQEERAEAIATRRRVVCNGLALITTVDGTPIDREFCGRHRDNLSEIRDCDEVLDDKDKPIFDKKYPKPDERSRICYGEVVRVGRTEGERTQIDCNEDQKEDGWTLTKNLSTGFDTRPKWFQDRTVRRGISRAQSGCKFQQ